MLLSEFDYCLPEELIAQSPPEVRGGSRLMLLNKAAETIETALFPDLLHHLQSGDLLVLNDTRVIPARLFGKKESGGATELLLVRRQPGADERWSSLIRSSKAPKPGTIILLQEGVRAEVIEKQDADTWSLLFSGTNDFPGWLDRSGRLPLPPYIKREPFPADRERYQTVFASAPGAVAAPTAGLHLTETMLAAVALKGIDVAHVTLHVGLGTFLPVRVEDLDQHRMHREEYLIPPATAAAIASCRAGGRRIVAIGTTVARTLEQAADAAGAVVAGRGEADIFIRPGYEFKVVNALLTNFHLPKSTLLMLVSAFAGREFLFSAYQRAVLEKFRFFSYGDAMFIE